MSVKYLLLALAVTAAALVKAENCDCGDQGDTKELWDFFKKISPDIDNPKEEEKDMYAVLPGLLSPLFECNCLEKNRRKREVLLQDASVQPTEESKQERKTPPRHRKSIRFGSRHCPTGFARIGYLCVKEEFLE